MKNIFRFIFSIVLTTTITSASGQVMFSTPVRQPIQFGESDSLSLSRLKQNAQSNKNPFVVTFMGQSLQPPADKETTVSSPAQPHYKAVSANNIGHSDSLVVLLLEDSLSKVRTQLSTLSTPEYPSPENTLRTIPSILPIRIRSWSEYRVSRGFGLRYHPVRGTVHNHAGIDLPQTKFSPVFATADGIVDRVVWQPDGIGLAIYIKHASGYQTGYGHLEDHSVLVGEPIRRGQVIGHIGDTGMTTGPHLHYSVLWGSEPVDPTDFCFLLMKTLQPVKPAILTLPRFNKGKYLAKGHQATTITGKPYVGISMLKEGLIKPLKPLSIQQPISLMALSKRALSFGH